MNSIDERVLQSYNELTKGQPVDQSHYELVRVLWAAHSGASVNAQSSTKQKQHRD